MFYEMSCNFDLVKLFFFANQILQECGYHVLALDYRGYGDSTPRRFYPDEPSMTADAVAAFDWVSARVEPGTNTRVIVNGHSLGTGVSCALAHALKVQGRGKLKYRI